MATNLNATQITPPRVPLTDERTGAVSREWYRWFYSLYDIVGTGTGIIPVTSGGTGLSTIPTNGQLLIGNGTGYTLNTLTASSGITVTNAAGAITVANSGVLSFSGGTTGLTPATATTGAVTLAGTLAIANGGTNGSATPTAYGVAYGDGSAYAFTAAGTTGQILTATTGGAPNWATPATSGTVTSVSVVSANGFAGTVATATSTPAITLTTTITGVLKGNGTAISAAVPNTDYIAPSAVVTKTANFSLADTENWVINNKTGSTCTVTLPAASSWSGRYVTFKNMQAQTLVSASSNVVPIDSTTAGTAILLGVVGNWATLVSDGTNWIIMQSAPNNILLLE
jgi:hypothetical protein